MTDIPDPNIYFPRSFLDARGTAVNNGRYDTVHLAAPHFTQGQRNAAWKWDPDDQILYAPGQLQWDQNQQRWVPPHRLTPKGIPDTDPTTVYPPFKPERNPANMTYNVNREEVIKKLNDLINEIDDSNKELIKARRQELKQKHKDELADFERNPSAYVSLSRHTTEYKKYRRNLELATDKTIEMTDEELNRILNGQL